MAAILLLVTWTGKMENSIFLVLPAPEKLISWVRFGRNVPCQPAYSLHLGRIYYLPTRLHSLPHSGTICIIITLCVSCLFAYHHSPLTTFGRLGINRASTGHGCWFCLQSAVLIRCRETLNLHTQAESGSYLRDPTTFPVTVTIRTTIPHRQVSLCNCVPLGFTAESPSADSINGCYIWSNEFAPPRFPYSPLVQWTRA